LFAGNAEWRTRDARRQEINAGEILMPDLAEILLNDVPMRPVFPQGGAVLRLKFNGGGVLKAGHLQTEGLATTTRAKFQDGKTHLNLFELIREVTASWESFYPVSAPKTFA
jgi:hypothetical protein